MLDFGAVALEWNTMLVQLIVFLPVLLFYAFVIYAIGKTLSFMKTKIQLDRERNQKLDELLESQRRTQK
ncbi:hypothetical protein BAG01nite_24660 [Brevibacillus agri]|uniref:DUF4083 domain-containing protein n=1 Tax=Brevibacillus agri TaxID=51101 RepID=A0A3M8B037_9BACL|nr:MULTISPECIES: hypothetical protein [Brevibacillus]MED1825901.1 hypothetical protein [Brevibacillus agri]QAV13856.1 hypothetical protein BA6348_14460 [Brevibacillus agri]QHZ56464.1 hypothetical protein M655_012835 [Brevibacillus sp. NSP2.1]RNB56692.1 hypothetical protein EB820_08530 [Brevibacillus agri]GED26364.1 hypothetical protein BAG01nite_24660 [Brevibacillus agri]